MGKDVKVYRVTNPLFLFISKEAENRDLGVDMTSQKFFKEVPSGVL
jgi:hypothetical protein